MIKNLVITIPLLWAGLRQIFQPVPPAEEKYYHCIAYNMYPFWKINGVYEIPDSNRDHANFYYRFEYDRDGRIQEITYYKNHKLFNGSGGHYGNFGAPVVKFTYKGNEEIRSYYDVLGNKVNGRWGVHQDVYSLDDQGRMIRLHFKGHNGEPIAASNRVYAYKWDWIEDRVVEEVRYDQQGNAVPSDNEWQFESIQYVLNDKGQSLEIRHVDQTGKLIPNKAGVAVIQYKYNAEGQELGGVFLDQERKRTIIGPGSGQIEIAESSGTFDLQGRYVQEQYLDLNGQLTSFKPYRFCSKMSEYEKFDTPTLTYFSNEQDDPIDAFGRGYFYVRNSYDDDGYLTKTEYLKQNKLLVDRSDLGFATIHYTYDHLNRLQTIRHFDANGQLAKNLKTGYAGAAYRYEGLSNTPQDTLEIN